MEQVTLYSLAAGAFKLLCGGGAAAGLWKIIDRLLEFAEKGRERRAEQEGATNKLLQTQLDAANAKLLDHLEKSADEKLALVQEIADGRWFKSDHGRIQIELNEAKAKMAALEVELKQSQTVAQSYKFFGDLMNDEVGIAFLRQRVEEKRDEK